jgi:glycosyltransferase involved in cell wall biosynthesis
MFSVQWLPDAIAPKVRQLNPDIVHLHWICNGFMQIETLSKLNQPLVWTLHDMWPLTGGCNYSKECDRYTQSCGACPQLKSTREQDLSRWVWRRKAKAWKNLNLTIVSPSHWLADCARSSPLFRNRRIEVIPHGLDLTKYRPIDWKIARQLLNLPTDKQLVLFGASPGTTGDQRKGFHLLQLALQRLGKLSFQNRLELVIFGDSQSDQSLDLDFSVHYLGQLHDDLSLALAYASADVMVVPSLQEAFGQTASESLACGTPVVAFNATGLQDIVEHQRNGYLAKPFEIEDLIQGITWILEDCDRHQKLRAGARKKAEQEFGLELQAQRYLSLFNQIFTDK